MLVNIWLCESFAQDECLTTYQNTWMQINRNNVKISCIMSRIQQKFSLVIYSLEVLYFPYMIHTIVSLRVNQTQFFMNKIYEYQKVLWWVLSELCDRLATLFSWFNKWHYIFIVRKYLAMRRFCVKWVCYYLPKHLIAKSINNLKIAWIILPIQQVPIWYIQSTL